MTDLREALAARPDDDFVVSAPPRRTAPARRAAPARRTVPARGKTKREPGIAARLLLLVARRPREVFATIVLTGCAGAIAWNALALQTVRHPAPLFSHEAARQAESRSPAASSVLPPMRPSAAESQDTSLLSPHPTASVAPAPARAPSRSGISDLITGNGEITQPQRVVAPPPPAPPPPRGALERDPIADIIRMGGPVPVPPGNIGRPDAGDLVLSGQRALARLGYSVKPDGIMGHETSQAIERFERDRRLPVTGEFSARTVRALAAESGIPLP